MMVSKGKYTANFNATVAMRGRVEMWQGQWHIYDTTSNSTLAVRTGAAGVVKEVQDSALEDARLGAIADMDELIERDG